MILIFLYFFAALSLAIWIFYLLRIRESIRQDIPLTSSEIIGQPSLSILIPAYNEEQNISTILSSCLFTLKDYKYLYEILVLDDNSQDKTTAELESFKRAHPSLNLKHWVGTETPAGWTGKNWACAQLSQRATGDYLLFLDADVRLLAGGLELALSYAQKNQSALLSGTPDLLCEHWSEILVQPLLVAGARSHFNFERVNDPLAEEAFASGPFMLFERGAYFASGGHEAVAAEIVEDVSLSKLFKSLGLRVALVDASKVYQLQMYSSFGQLWEGWTKNVHLAFGRKFEVTSLYALVQLFTNLAPFGLLVGAVVFKSWVVFGVSLFCFWAQGYIFGLVAPRYWFYFWVSPIGSLIVFAIFLGSIWKTETGLGWTWRGRQLRL